MKRIGCAASDNCYKMLIMKVRRETISPAPGSPNWTPLPESQEGLLYLGWGTRQYGKHPIPVRMHDGWTYTIVMSGHPTLVIGDKRRPLSPGSLVLAGPDVPFGWEDKPKAACSILVWVWKAQPRQHSQPSHSPKLCWIRSPEKADCKVFAALHQDTLREIRLADKHTPAVMETLHRRLDAEFERASEPQARAASLDAQRLQLAEAWMQRHLALRSPTAALADYLGISAMTLLRIYRRSLNRSPGEAFLSLKMQRAKEMLAANILDVKNVAFELGYSHPGDFSRAFSRFHRCTPGSVRTRSP